MNKVDHLPVGFFVLRTPLLPVSGPPLGPMGTATERREGLRQWAKMDHVLDAIMLGAPAFGRILSEWLVGDRKGDDSAICASLWKYFHRMSRRPTPFGLFAGTTIGTIADRTVLRLRGLEEYEKHVLVDFDVMTAVAADVRKRVALMDDVRVQGNPTIYGLGGQWRFVERSVERGAAVAYSLSAIDQDEGVVDEIMMRLRETQRVQDLVCYLGERGVQDDDARAFLAEMAAAGVLQVVCEPPLISANPIVAWQRRLSNVPSREAAEARDVAKEVAVILGRLDATRPGADCDSTKQLLDGVAKFRGAEDCANHLDVRLSKPPECVSLGRNVVETIRQGIRGLAIASGKRRPRGTHVPRDLRRFIARFGDRYGDAMVPLCEALDSESGIGFAGAWDAGPRQEVAEGDADAGADWVEMLRKEVWKTGLEGSDEIALRDIGCDLREPLPRLPNGFLVYGRLAARSPSAIDNGQYRVLLGGVAGPSAVSQLGRFCTTDAQLAGLVRDQIARESGGVQGAIVAELAHLPSGRAGNVMARPPLTRYEIDFMGSGEAEGPYRILLADLMLSLEEGRLILRSSRLDREIVPRHSTAHASFQLKHLPAYRLLNALKWQEGHIDITWNWGALETTPFLPRVVLGRAVLSLARWTLGREELAGIGDKDIVKAADELSALRERRRIPGKCCILEEYAEQFVDFDAVESVDVMRKLANKGKSIVIVEEFPGEEELCVTGPEGAFIGEFMLPMMRPKLTVREATRRRIATGNRTVFAPGSEWLSVRAMAGWATIDRLLRELVAPMIGEHRANLGNWYYLRYGDPEPHLRLRFHAEPAWLWSVLMTDFHKRCRPWMDNRAITAVYADTYCPEVERYGGPDAMGLAEQLFWIDSESAVAWLSQQPSGDEVTRRLGVVKSVKWLLERLFPGRGIRGYAEIAEAARDQWLERLYGERAARTQTLRESSAGYRAARGEIEAALSSAPEVDATLLSDAAKVAREYRRLETARQLTAPFERIAWSFLHMHCNRRFRMDANHEELLVYDWLARWYKGLACQNGDT